MKLDPRVKLVIAVLASLSLFLNHDLWIDTFVVSILLLLFLLIRKYRIVLVYAIIYVTCVVVDLWIMDDISGPFLSLMSFLFYTPRFLMPMLISTHYLISTTSTSLLMKTLKWFLLPDALIIATAVALRYFPQIMMESRMIRDSMKLRSKHRFEYLFNPLAGFEALAVPMIMNATRSADQLSEASILKGLGYSKQRTSIERLRLHWFDALYLFGSIACFLVVYFI